MQVSRTRMLRETSSLINDAARAAHSGRQDSARRFGDTIDTMIRSLAGVIVLAALAAAPNAAAQADVSVRVELLDGRVVPPGTISRVRLTITNNGPGALMLPAAGGTSWTNFVGRRTIAIGSVPETPPCTISVLHVTAPPGQPDAFIATIFANQSGLAAGESENCVVGLTTFPDSPAQMNIRFAIIAPPDDPAPANNEVFTLVFTGASTYQMVPSSSATGLAMLLALLAFAGALALRNTGSGWARLDPR